MMRWLVNFLVVLAVLILVAGCLRSKRSEAPTDLPVVEQQEPVNQAAADPPPRPVNPAPVTVPEAAVDSTPAAATQAMEGERVTYRVQAGDTLWGIAVSFGVSLAALQEANGIQDADLIWVGQELRIPGVTTSRDVAEARPVPGPAEQPAVAHQPVDVVATTPAMDLELGLLPEQVLLEGIRHDWQKMNNCGPTTVVMALSYFDVVRTQFDSAPVLKGGPNDKNVSPHELVRYLHDQGFGGIVRVNGNLGLIRRLVSEGFPVIVEQWLDRPGDELTGHYRLVRGYDETTREIIVNDSYNGPKLGYAYEEFDRLWRAFNRLYIPVYRPEDEPRVQAIIGEDWQDAHMYRQAVATAEAEIEQLDDVYAWFNLGNSLLGLQEYERAAVAFEQAMEIGLPARMLWYQFGPFEALNQTGQYQRVLELSTPLIRYHLEEVHYQRGLAHEGLGDKAAAVVEYQQALALNARFEPAIEAVARLGVQH